MNITLFQSIAVNNLKAGAIHVCVCVIAFITIGIVWHLDIWWINMSRNEIATNWLMVGIYTIIVFFLYFCLGRKYLDNMSTTFANLLSITAVQATIILAVIIASSATNRMSTISLWVLSVFPIGETIHFFSNTKRSVAHLMASLLPSVAMWLGLISKKV